MAAIPNPDRRLRPATLLGLFLALVFPVLPAFVDPFVFGTAQSGARIVWGIAVHWANLAAVIAVVFWAERQRPASIGVRRFGWWTIPLGVIAGAVIMVVSGIVVNALKLSGDAHFAAYLLSLPIAMRCLIVATAGIFEETLYRGYALERLAALSGSKWAAAAVTVVCFTLAHVPAVGFSHLLPVFIVSVFVTLLYLWRRDLVVNIIAHATIDGIPLLLVPLLAHHGG